MMEKKTNLSIQTKRNWLIDAGLGMSALLAALSGIYFLFLPVSGYQGGRNPMYGVTVLFERSAWDDLHTWGGVVMIAIAAIHLTLHWSWVTNMFNRTLKELRNKVGPMNARGRFNLWLNVIVAISFVLTALSGIYFLFIPGGRSAVDPLLVFTRNTWDLIHTWAGVTMIAAAVVHFAIHWKWVTKVTSGIWRRKTSLSRPLPSTDTLSAH